MPSDRPSCSRSSPPRRWGSCSPDSSSSSSSSPSPPRRSAPRSSCAGSRPGCGPRSRAFHWVGLGELARFRAATGEASPPRPRRFRTWLARHPESDATRPWRIEMLSFLGEHGEARAELERWTPANPFERIHRASLAAEIGWQEGGPADLPALASLAAETGHGRLAGAAGRRWPRRLVVEPDGAGGDGSRLATPAGDVPGAAGSRRERPPCQGAATTHDRPADHRRRRFVLLGQVAARSSGCGTDARGGSGTRPCGCRSGACRPR